MSTSWTLLNLNFLLLFKRSLAAAFVQSLEDVRGRIAEARNSVAALTAQLTRDKAAGSPERAAAERTAAASAPVP